MALTIDYTDASDTAHVAAYWRLVELIFSQFGNDQRVQIMLRAYSSRNAARNSKQHLAGAELRFTVPYAELVAADGASLIAKVYAVAKARVPFGENEVDLRTAQDALE